MQDTGSLAIPKGSLVLVTGANGYLGSHIADQFLRFGYKVRGTVRDAEKNSWLLELFERDHGKGTFQLVEVPDMTADGAFDQAVKGTAAVAHSASVMTLDPDPSKVIPGAIAGATNALKSAIGEPGVKRFVFTSSSSAAVVSRRGAPGITLTEQTWNTSSVEAAWARTGDISEQLMNVYAASKSQAEQEIWKLYKENRDKRPDLIVNTILPNFNFGKVLDPKNQGTRSSSGFITALWQGELLPEHHLIVPQYFVDVQDVGRTHVGAAVLSNIQSQRIFAFAERFSWDRVLDILRVRDSRRNLPEKFSAGDDPNELHPELRARALGLLKDLGFGGWTSLEDSIANNLKHVHD